MRFLNPVGVVDHGDQMSVILIKFCMALAVFWIALMSLLSAPILTGITVFILVALIAAMWLHHRQMHFTAKLVWVFSGCVFMFVTKQLIPDFGGSAIRVIILGWARTSYRQTPPQHLLHRRPLPFRFC